MTAPDIVEIAVPDELPVKSVVLDCHGDAWQRRPNGDWVRVMTIQVFGMTQIGKSWQHLVVDAAPLTVIHRAEDTK